VLVFASSALAWLALAASPGTAAAAQAEPASPVWPQPQQYTAHVRYDDQRKTLTGREWITFANHGPDELSSVWLRVWPNGYGSCARPWAMVSVKAGGRSAGWGAHCTALQVRLAQPVAPGGSGGVTVRLRVKVPPKANRFGQDGESVYLGNALPLLDVEDKSGPGLEPYTDLGDPFYSLSANWSVTLDMPRSLVAATTGSVTARRRLSGG
jgi:hypothetical protein